jgi:hypothetical protein
MKKVMAFLAAGLIFLTACGPTLDENGLVDIDETKPYYVHLIGGPEYQSWFNYLKEQRAKAEQKLPDEFIYHEVKSGLDAKDLVQELVDKKVDGYVNMILVGFGPYDYVGGSSEAAEENFNKNKAYVQSLVDITLNKGVVLLIGNGYPRTADETDEFLLWNHEQMRQFLEDQMYATFRVYNFTMKRALGSNETGIIRDETDEQRNAQLTNDFATYLSLIKKHI